MILDYLLQNWGLILILSAFAVSLFITVFIDKTTKVRMFWLIAGVFLLSIAVFYEFRLEDLGTGREIRVILMAVRYSATPLILAQIIYSLVKKAHWYIFIPALALCVLNVVSIFTGIVFSVDDHQVLVRGPLGFIPFTAAGAYCFFLIYFLLKQSNKNLLEIVPVVFLSLAFVAGLLLPFVLGKDFSKIFCTTIAIALFVYYVFMILQITKKDSLTGLLNRHAFYADTTGKTDDITAVISLDVNGLKAINDSEGHDAGDNAISSIAFSVSSALKSRQSGYRVGGDEFIILCRKNSPDDVRKLIDRINKNVSESQYNCSIGYCLVNGRKMTVDDMLRESDSMMYAEKARHYAESGFDRRNRR